MTRKEKEDYLYEYCELTEFKCESCVLNDKSHNWRQSLHEDYKCLAIDVSPEEDLDRAINIIQNSIDNVNHPAHYNDGKIEVIDYIEDKKLGFCLGNAIKYISRAGKKDKSKEVEDLQKAVFYINREIDKLKNKE